MDYNNLAYENIYVGNSVNQLFLNLLNPLHPLSWQKVYVHIEKPFQDLISPDEDYKGLGMTKEQYEQITYYDINTFTLTWGLPFKEFLDSENGIVYPMFLDLLEEAKRYIRYAWVKDEFKWRKLVSLYVAHHLELFFEIIKDMENDRSFNVRITDEDEHRKIVVGQEVMKDYKTTLYGRLFWQEYYPIGKYKNPMWGVI